MWEIVIALVAFAVSMIALMTPIVKLNGTITELNTTVSILNETIATNEDSNKSAHQEFYRRIEDLEKDTTKIKTKMDIYHEH